MCRKMGERKRTSEGKIETQRKQEVGAIEVGAVDKAGRM